MYLEFKDSFKSEKKNNCFYESVIDKSAVNQLNEWIETHKNYKIQILTYAVVYSPYFSSSQAHILAEAKEI